MEAFKPRTRRDGEFWRRTAIRNGRSRRLMNKAPETISRRQSDLINEINARSNERVGDVINDFANRHYLSESTVWKDYKLLRDPTTTNHPTKRVQIPNVTSLGDPNFNDADSGDLRKSIKRQKVTWRTIVVGSRGVSYAKYHNRPHRGMTQRKFIGESHKLNLKIRLILHKRFKQALKK